MRPRIRQKFEGGELSHCEVICKLCWKTVCVTVCAFNYFLVIFLDLKQKEVEEKIKCVLQCTKPLEASEKDLVSSVAPGPLVGDL